MSGTEGVKGDRTSRYPCQDLNMDGQAPESVLLATRPAFFKLSLHGNHLRGCTWRVSDSAGLGQHLRLSFLTGSQEMPIWGACGPHFENHCVRPTHSLYWKSKSQSVKTELWIGLLNEIQDAQSCPNLNELFIQINNKYFFSLSVFHVKIRQHLLWLSEPPGPERPESHWEWKHLILVAECCLPPSPNELSLLKAGKNAASFPSSYQATEFAKGWQPGEKAAASNWRNNIQLHF